MVSEWFAEASRVYNANANALHLGGTLATTTLAKQQ
jgi:hypothetical protein